EDKTASLQARAGAVDELISSGALEDVTGSSKDDLSAQLDALSSDNDVEMELNRMRDSLPASSNKQQQSLEGEDK
ncbi:MAG: PspA/IM30 family protein, partial [Brevibacterium sp.]|nr:PspA/IM30 family protein [Brevibacterium sp.]